MPLLATTSTLQVGTYNPLNGVFTQTFDLNDFATFWIEWNSFKIPQPKKVYVRNSNIRFPGEVVQRYQYQNRHIQCSVRLKNTSTPMILNSIRALLAAIENPPYELRIAQPGAANFTYADVVAVTHNIPADPQALLAQVIPSIQIDFECKPGLPGDTTTLTNYVFNPGFEAPSGITVAEFSDSFANNNAYTFGSGSGVVASNIMTLSSGAFCTFGSPAWNAVANFAVRWQFKTGLTAFFYPHFVDNNNQIFVEVTSTALQITHIAAGVTSNIYVSGAIGPLVNNNWYWMQYTQFPGPAGARTAVNVLLSNDSGGTVGSTVLSTGSVATQSSTSAGLTGKAALQASGATMPVGGAFSSVMLYGGFGPGAWQFIGLQNSATGAGFGAWEQTPANCFPNGPVTSFGAARIDFAPAGQIDAQWISYTGGSPAGTYVIPVANFGDVMQARAWVKTSGFSGTAHVQLVLAEYTSAGAFIQLNQTDVLANTLTNWTQLSFQGTTSGTTTYAAVAVRVFDATAGASANATLWIDNVQCWDQTRTQQLVMPYCENRFPQTPGQIMVSGIQGDLLAPCIAEIGAYFNNFATSQSAKIYLGRRATTTANMRLVAPSTGYGTNAFDASQYGGYALLANPGPLVFSTQAESGAFHLFARVSTANGAPTGVTIAPQVFTLQVPVGQSPILLSDATLGAWQGANVSPLTASNVFTSVDLGQIILPISPLGILTDPTQQAGYISSTSSGGSQLSVGFVALLPVDGDLFVASIYNPSGGSAVGTDYLFLYWDGNTPGATSYSTEFWNLGNPAHAITNQGPQSNNFTPLLATPVGDSLAQLDPTIGTPGNPGVNQFLLHYTDNNALECPVVCDFIYRPLYLYPR